MMTKVTLTNWVTEAAVDYTQHDFNVEVFPSPIGVVKCANGAQIVCLKVHGLFKNTNSSKSV